MATLDGTVVGREKELERVGRFVAETEHLPAALLLEGEAGIGKTTLWYAALAVAELADYCTLRAAPSQAEARLTFAAAVDLLRCIDHSTLDALPNVQRRALEGALLLESDEAAIDGRVVATAFLGALRGLAADRPVVVAIDDVQWLDAESALLVSFAARRLTSEPIAFIVARRSGEGTAPPLDLGRRVEQIVIEPLSLGAIHRLIHERLDVPLPRPLLRWVYEISGGNPFFALELASAMPSDASATNVTLPTSLERLVGARLRGLPHRARDTLAELAALPDLSAAEPDADVVAAAVDAGVLTSGPRGIEFAHPLLRAAAYAQLTPSRRRRLHRLLADAATDAAERAHHLALAVDEPDDALATIIEEGAVRAEHRGAPAVAAELLEHAARVTVDEEQRFRRALQAARWKREAGDADGARAALRALLEQLATGPLRAEALAALADDIGVEVEEAVAVAEEGLAQPGLTDVVRTQLLLALSDTVFLQNDLHRSSDCAGAALTVAERAGDAALLARAVSWNAQLASLTASRAPWSLFERAHGVEHRLAHVDPWRAAGHWHGVSLMWADRLREGRALLEEQYERAAELGNETARAGLCFHLAQLECRAGALQRAAHYAREGHELTTLIGHGQLAGILLNGRALVAANLGDAAEARAFAETALAVTAGTGDAFFAIHHRVVLGLLEATLGDYAAVHRQLGGLDELLTEMGAREPGVFPFHGDELDALVALGELDAAERLIVSLDARAQELRRPRLAALAWRGRGMLGAARGDAASAAQAFARALAEHDSLELPLERARTLLAQGVALRRARQKRSAREALERAEAAFEACGARLWAGRARGELARVSGRGPSRGELTPTERRVAELAAAGKANKEIASELYVTVRTVETHLTKVYEKLGIRARGELARRLSP